MCAGGASNYAFCTLCNGNESFRVRHDGLLEYIFVANQPTNIFRRGRGGSAALTRSAMQGILPVRPGLIPSGAVPKKAAGSPMPAAFLFVTSPLIPPSVVGRQGH